MLGSSIVVLACSLSSGLHMGLYLSMEHLHLGALRAQWVEVVLNFRLNFHFFAVNLNNFPM